MRKTFTKLATDLKLVAPATENPPSSKGIFYIKFESDLGDPKNLLISYHMPETQGGHISFRNAAAVKVFVGDFEQEGRITQRDLSLSWEKLRQDMTSNSSGDPEAVKGFLKTFFQRKNFQFIWNEIFFPYFELSMAEKVHFKRFLKYSTESLEVYLLNLNLPKAASFFLAASTLIDEMEGNSAQELMELASKSEDPILLEVVDVLKEGFKEAGVEPNSLESFNAALDCLDEKDAELQEQRKERIGDEIEEVVKALNLRVDTSASPDSENELAKKIKELSKDIEKNARALKAALLASWALLKDGNAFMMCEYAILALDEFIPLDEQTSQEPIDKKADAEAMEEGLDNTEQPSLEPEEEPLPEPKQEEEDPKASAPITGTELAFLQAILPDKLEEESTLSLNLDTETLRAFEQVIHEKEGASTEELKALEDQAGVAVVKAHLTKAQVLHFLQEKGIVVGEGVEVFYGPYEVGQHLPGTVLPFSLIKGKTKNEA